MYTQTRLERWTEDGTGRIEMVSWIPLKIAAKGNVVRLKDTETGEWTEGWKVLDEPAAPYHPEGMLMKQSRDYKRTRIASDICRRK
jgi:hypothetical protein